MKKCYLCNEDLTEKTISLEHIIPSALGGKLKSKELICGACNQSTSIYDNQLINIGQPFAVRYKIKREGSKVSKMTVVDEITGKEVILMPGGIVIQKETTITHTEYGVTISARDAKNLKQAINKYNKEQNKFGKSIPDDIIPEIVGTDQKNPVYKDIVIDYDYLSRAAVKQMCSFYLHNVGNVANITRAIKYINDLTLENTYFEMYDFELSKILHNSNPYHILIVKGDRRQKAIYGYFELFGANGFVTILNPRYEGDDFQFDYTFDPLNAKEIDFKYSFSVSVTALLNLISINSQTNPEFAGLRKDINY